MNQPAISVRDLTIRYHAEPVLAGIDLDVTRGEFVVLLGPSGCGKSTLLNAIAGLIDAADGEIRIGGRDVTWVEPKDRGIGMVFQSYALYPRMTVEGNLGFGLKVAGTPRAVVRDKVAAVARMLQLESLLARRPAELSGGQRQRVAIGRALVRDVDVFLFDEPLSNLDTKLRNQLRVEIKQLHQKLGSTMVYVTHDQVEAMTLASRIAVMSGGVIQQFADPQTVYHQPANRFVAGFLGSPSMNFIDGEIMREDGGWRFEAPAATRPLAIVPATGDPAAGTSTAGIRPEHLRPVEPGAGFATGTVAVVEATGADTIVWLDLAGTRMAMRLDGNARVSVGEAIGMSPEPGRVLLFDGATGHRL